MENAIKSCGINNTDWVAVPIEPTPEMYERVLREGYYHDEESAKSVLRSEYQDMLAAAPKVESEIDRLNEKLEKIKHFVTLNADKDVFDGVVSIICE